MNTPLDLKYTASHEWCRSESDGSITVGITDHAQELLGDLVFIDLPKVGDRLQAGQEVVVVESVKAAADAYAPLSGTVMAINETLKDSPEAVNKDAYAAWLFKIKPDNSADLAGLLDAAAYQRSVDASA